MSKGKGRKDKVILRPERAEDKKFLFSVFCASREAEMEASGLDDAQRKMFLDSQFRLQREDYHRRYPDATFQIVELEKRPVGVFHVMQDEKEIRVIDLCLLTPYRTQQIEEYLIRKLQSQAQKHEKPIRLRIERFNPYVPLLERLGFFKLEETGIRYVMEWLPKK